MRMAMGYFHVGSSPSRRKNVPSNVGQDGREQRHCTEPQEKDFLIRGHVTPFLMRLERAGPDRWAIGRGRPPLPPFRNSPRDTTFKRPT
jgi:hypothetical protein